MTMEWMKVWKPLPEIQPRKVLIEGFTCSSGQHVFAGTDDSTYRVAQYCCGPWVCTNCDRPMMVRGYTWCEACRLVEEEARWCQAPRAEAGDVMIYAEAIDRWFTSLGDFLEWLREDGEGDGIRTIESVQPWIGEFHATRVPDLAEIVGDDMHPDWDGQEDWLNEIQEAVRAAFKAHGLGCWHKGKTVPIVPVAATVAIDA